MDRYIDRLIDVEVDRWNVSLSREYSAGYISPFFSFFSPPEGFVERESVDVEKKPQSVKVDEEHC